MPDEQVSTPDMLKYGYSYAVSYTHLETEDEEVLEDGFEGSDPIEESDRAD